MALLTAISSNVSYFLFFDKHRQGCTNTEWPKKIYALFTHQYLWNKFK